MLLITEHKSTLMLLPSIQQCSFLGRLKFVLNAVEILNATRATVVSTVVVVALPSPLNWIAPWHPFHEAYTYRVCHLE